MPDVDEGGKLLQTGRLKLDSRDRNEVVVWSGVVPEQAPKEPKGPMAEAFASIGFPSTLPLGKARNNSLCSEANFCDDGSFP